MTTQTLGTPRPWWPGQIPRRLAAAAIFVQAFALGGCGGSFQKREHFVSYGAGTDVNYYRITIRGEGNFGDMEYRSGWYDAAAVDRLFGDVAERRTLEKKAALAQGNAAVAAMEKYLQALSADKLDEKLIADRKKAYEDAINAITGLAPAGTDRMSASSYADKKLVMMMSNDPSAIVDAIKGQIQGQKLVGAIAKKVAEDDARSAQTAQRDLQVNLDQAEAGIQSIIEASQKLEELGANPDKKAVREIINGLAAELEAQ